MFSQVRKTLFRELSQKHSQPFGLRKLVHDFLYRDDKSSQFYQVAALDPRQPLNVKGQIIENEGQLTYTVSKLNNGITVLTESGGFPSRVDLGVLLEVGTRDETEETSGSLLSIKNTCYKTVMNTNETINYGIVQMSGGDYGVEYDQETTYFKAHCLSHDVVDVFRMMADCALEPRSVVAANVGLDKNLGTHKLEAVVQSGEAFNEAVFQTAYGKTGLGMPVRGYRHNINNLNAFTLQKFQAENINPNGIIVCASGIYNHQEFVDLASETLSFVQPNLGGVRQRAVTSYVGGEVRSLTDDSDINLALVFPTVEWKSKEMILYQLLHVLLGGHTSVSQSRLARNIIAKNYYADSACSVNFNFSDAGLFGIKISGAADKGNELLTSVVGEFKSLTQPISNQELNRAKQILRANIFSAMEKQDERLEEAVKNVRIWNAVKFEKYAQTIDQITSEQINQAAARVLQSRPTFVAQGGLVNRLPSYDQIQNQLKL